MSQFVTTFATKLIELFGNTEQFFFLKLFTSLCCIYETSMYIYINKNTET